MENSNTDNNRLIELLTLAKGDRSWNQYALNSGVDAGHLSRLRKEKFIKPPKPDLLNRLAQKAYNGVTYEQLMIAAGYLNYDANSSFIKYSFPTPDGEMIIDSHGNEIMNTIKGDKLPKELAEIDPEMAIQIIADNNGLSADDIKSIIETVKKIKSNIVEKK